MKWRPYKFNSWIYVWMKNHPYNLIEKLTYYITVISSLFNFLFLFLFSGHSLKYRKFLASKDWLMDISIFSFLPQHTSMAAVSLDSLFVYLLFLNVATESRDWEQTVQKSVLQLVEFHETAVKVRPKKGVLLSSTACSNYVKFWRKIIWQGRAGFAFV